MIPYSRPKVSDFYTLPQSKMLVNHTLHSGTYLYGPYMAVPPTPPGDGTTWCHDQTPAKGGGLSLNRVWKLTKKRNENLRRYLSVPVLSSWPDWLQPGFRGWPFQQFSLYCVTSQKKRRGRAGLGQGLGSKESFRGVRGSVGKNNGG